MGILSHVRDSVEADIHEIKDKLRDIDKFECWATSNSTPEVALSKGYDMGLLCRTITHNKEPIAMYGVTPIESEYFKDAGVVWLLGTDKTNKATSILVKEGHKWVEEMLASRSVLLNYVHASNEISIKWLRFLGFKFTRAIPYGVEKEPFRLFYKLKGVNHV